MIGALDRAALHRAYASGALTPQDVVEEVLARIAARGDDAVWIHLLDPDRVREQARALHPPRPGPDLPPLYGLPFAVKDNIDVQGLPTTAGCPDFAYTARRTAPVVQRALDAGAILVGKTNLDQFATGLTGTRSPYGIVRNPVDPRVIAGGSSSGSAVAVAAGLVTFAIGTDTAGSGRVPAGLTGTVGVKPSRGLVSTRGIVPACRSLDCASIFALSAADGAAVLSVVAGQDAEDAYSRGLPVPPARPGDLDLGALHIGVPAHRDVAADFDGDADAAHAFEDSVQRLAALGARLVPVDLAPFLEVGRLLYDGPWLAERVTGIGQFLAASPDSLHPVTRAVLSGAGSISGIDAFHGIHALAAARARIAPVWQGVDALMLPTVPTAPTIARVLADPIGANAVLGRYTTFVNLLDLAAIAVPSTATPAGVPVGVTFVAPAGADGLLASIGASWQAARGGNSEVASGGSGGAGLRDPGSAPGGARVPGDPASAPGGMHVPGDSALVAVVGAHLEGEPLHGALLALGAQLHARVTTAPAYRLYELPADERAPARPGLVRVPSGGGAIEAEVYRMPVGSLGRLVADIPPPLGIGTVRLADGAQVLGFLCEHAATHAAPDITDHGGWRAYRAR